MILIPIVFSGLCLLVGAWIARHYRSTDPFITALRYNGWLLVTVLALAGWVLFLGAVCLGHHA